MNKKPTALISIPLRLSGPEAIFDPLDARDDRARSLAPEILQTMEAIYTDQVSPGKRRRVRTVIIVRIEGSLSAEKSVQIAEKFRATFNRYQSRIRNFLRIYTRKFIVWLTMALVLFSVSAFMESRGKQDFIYTVIGIVIWILIDNIVETFFMDSAGKRKALMLYRFANAEVTVVGTDEESPSA